MNEIAVSFSGNLVQNLELRSTRDGKPYVNFSVAVNHRKYDRNQGGYIDAGATFLNCTAWGRLAENAVNSLAKGNRVSVTGFMQQSSYDDAEGNRRTSMNISVTDLGVSLKTATAIPQSANVNAPSSGGWGNQNVHQPANFADSEPPF